MNLAAIDQRKARVVELKYFGGLTTDETPKFSEYLLPPSSATGIPRRFGCTGKSQEQLLVTTFVNRKS